MNPSNVYELYYGHDLGLIHQIHDWLYYHHVWAIPLLAFVFSVTISYCTIKFLFWWRFDRKGSKHRCPKRSNKYN